MATTFTGITIIDVATDEAISEDEATSSFTISGTGKYSGSDPASSMMVTLTWIDENNTSHTQNINATVNIIDKTGKDGKTFEWSITESDFDTFFNDESFPFGAGQVTVTFGTKVSNTVELSSIACFLRGTRVLTRHGYCPVEELAVGDEVRTLSGNWQPLRWIGHQSVVTPFGLAKSAPVRITAGAFGPALPERDVCVSPDHAIFFRNQLIPAKFLVNGVTIFRDTSIENIEYFHLLLDQHAVIFSEGLATESYVPCENIDWFDNTAECPQALLNAIRAGTAECLNECYPRKTTGRAVEAARALLTRFAPADAKDRAVG